MRAQGLNGGGCLFAVVRDDDALARGQAVRFHHHRKRKFAERRRGFLKGIRAYESRGRNSHAAHEFLCIDFARLELRLFLRRAKDNKTARPKLIGDTLREWRLRSNYSQLCTNRFGGGQIVAGIEQFCDACTAGVAGSSENFVSFHRDFPGDRVFAAAAANDKDFHGESASVARLRLGRPRKCRFDKIKGHVPTRYQVVVIGGGHAGCEAARACARLGVKTAMITMNSDLIAQMSCNPAIGGIAKGHLVREIDALGGLMGEVTDAVGIQFRLLNTSRGPAVWSPRAQCDKKQYRLKMRDVLEREPNLRILQAEVAQLAISDPPNRRVHGVVLRDGRTIEAEAVVITTGTFLNGLAHIGEQTYSCGRNGEAASNLLGEQLRSLGLRWTRLKTGTPPRLDARSIDFSRFEEQSGDPDPTPFSFLTNKIEREQIKCYISYTTPESHAVIRENLVRSPLYSGQIEGIGPRYCPSLEDKVVKFPDKSRHQLFLEPEGLDTNEDLRERYVDQHAD